MKSRIRGENGVGANPEFILPSSSLCDLCASVVKILHCQKRKEMEEWRRATIKRVHGFARLPVVRARVQNVFCGTRAKKPAHYV